MTLLKGYESPGLDLHLLARRHFPNDLAIEGARLYIQEPFIMPHVGSGELKRFLIYKQSDDLGICHVKYCLTRPCVTIDFFPVNKRPRFIKSVHKRDVLHAGTS